MQKSGKRRRHEVILGTFCAFALVLTAGAAAQQRDHVWLAEALTRAAFPDLSGEISLNLNPDRAADWRMAPRTTVSVRTFDASAPNHSRVVLSISIQATNGLLKSASFFDEAMHADRVQLFRSAQQKTGDLASNVVAELRRRGAKYLPSANGDFLAALNVNRFSLALGEIQKARAHFQGVPPVQVGPDVEAWPTWIVDVETAQADANLCYSFLVDPITLNPTRIMQVECKTR